MSAPETKAHFTFSDLELESVRPRVRTGAATGADDPPLDGTKTMSEEMSIIWSRKTWLRVLHSLCFAIHTTWFVLTIAVAWGKGPDMRVDILRVKSQWKMPGKYGYEVAQSPGIPYVRFDLLVSSFFALSALMHGMWVTDGLVVLVAHCFKRKNWGRVGKWLLWDRLDQCLCWWCANAVL